MFPFDGLEDSVETNTGIFAGPGDTSTDPNKPDSDADGLQDGIEVNTFTDPTNADSDDDGINNVGDLLLQQQKLGL